MSVIITVLSALLVVGGVAYVVVVVRSAAAAIEAGRAVERFRRANGLSRWNAWERATAEDPAARAAKDKAYARSAVAIGIWVAVFALNMLKTALE